LTFEVLDEEVSNVVWLFVEAPYTLEARKLTFAVEGNFEIRSRAFAISKKNVPRFLFTRKLGARHSGIGKLQAVVYLAHALFW